MKQPHDWAGAQLPGVLGSDFPRPILREQKRMNMLAGVVFASLRNIVPARAGWPVGLLISDDKHKVVKADKGLRGAAQQHKKSG